MKLTATREALARELAIDQVITVDDNVWIIDKMSIGRESMDLLCLREGSESKRRTGIKLGLDDKVVVGPGHADAAEILAQIVNGQRSSVDGDEIVWAQAPQVPGVDKHPIGYAATITTSSGEWQVQLEA